MTCARQSVVRRRSWPVALLVWCVGLSIWCPASRAADTAAHAATRSLVIAVSSSVAEPIRALGEGFESVQPEVSVHVVVLPGLDLRRTIAAVENRPAPETGFPVGPIHLVAPGSDEFLNRLLQRGYIVPGSSHAYATVPLVLVVPESLAEAPESFEALKRTATVRVAVADPQLTTIGQRTQAVLASLGGAETFRRRMDISPDVEGVLDHLLSGQADVAIVSGPQAYRQRERVRVVARAPEREHPSPVYALARLRSCPDRAVAEAFLEFVHTAEARRIVTSLGYGAPPQ